STTLLVVKAYPSPETKKPVPCAFSVPDVLSVPAIGWASAALSGFGRVALMFSTAPRMPAARSATPSGSGGASRPAITVSMGLGLAASGATAAMSTAGFGEDADGVGWLGASG